MNSNQGSVAGGCSGHRGDSSVQRLHSTAAAPEICPVTPTESYIQSQVQSALLPGEQVVHMAYLVGFMHVTGLGELGRGISAFRAAASTRACFLVLTNQRLFLLWSKPGRIGAFAPLHEHEQMQSLTPDQVASARVTRAGLFGKRLELSLRGGERLAFHLKRKVSGLPDQARCIDALLAAHGAAPTQR